MIAVLISGEQRDQVEGNLITPDQVTPFQKGGPDKGLRSAKSDVIT